MSSTLSTLVRHMAPIQSRLRRPIFLHKRLSQKPANTMRLVMALSFAMLLLASSTSIFANPPQPSIVQIATDDYLPLTSRANGGSGVVSDIVEAAFAAQGIQTEFVFASWKRSELLAQEGKVLGVIPYFVNEKRQKLFHFSSPLLKGDTHFYYNHEQFPEGLEWQSLNDFKGFRMGAVPGYWYVPEFEKYGLDLHMVDTEQQNFLKLVHQRVDFILIGQARAELALQALPPEDRAKIKALEKAESHNYFHAIISRTYPHASYYNKELSKGMKKILDSGEYLRILGNNKLSKDLAVTPEDLNLSE